MHIKMINGEKGIREVGSREREGLGFIVLAQYGHCKSPNGWPQNTFSTSFSPSLVKIFWHAEKFQKSTLKNSDKLFKKGGGGGGHFCN